MKSVSSQRDRYAMCSYNKPNKTLPGNATPCYARSPEYPAPIYTLMLRGRYKVQEPAPIIGCLDPPVVGRRRFLRFRDPNLSGLHQIQSLSSLVRGLSIALRKTVAFPKKIRSAWR